jgi:hypothetical protein
MAPMLVAIKQNNHYTSPEAYTYDCLLAPAAGQAIVMMKQ